MAEYASYSHNSLSSITQNKMTNDGVKRAPLAVLNHNQKLQPNQSKSHPWQNSQKNEPAKKTDNFKFAIFQDESMNTNDSSAAKTPALPACLTRFLTYDEESHSFQKGTKENDPYFDILDMDSGEKDTDYLNWTCPYRDDIYWYIKELETKFRPRSLYMNKQPDITLSMRSILVDWLIEVGEEYKLQSETVHLAVAYTDRFLSQMSVLRGKLQLVGTASLFIASKHEEIYPPELKDFVYITDDTYTKKQILRMESFILSVLNFDLATPTAYSFLQLFCCMSVASEQVSFLAQYICDISLLEAEPFLGFLPSQIGASCLVLANYTLGNSLWSDELVKLTGYCLDDIGVIVQCLYEKYSTILSYPQKAVCDKYKSSKYQCVTDIQCPERLII